MPQQTPTAKFKARMVPVAPSPRLVQPHFLRTIRALSEELNDMNFMLQDLSFGITDLRGQIAVLSQYSRNMQ